MPLPSADDLEMNWPKLRLIATLDLHYTRREARFMQLGRFMDEYEAFREMVGKPLNKQEGLFDGE